MSIVTHVQIVIGVSGLGMFSLLPDPTGLGYGIWRFGPRAYAKVKFYAGLTTCIFNICAYIPSIDYRTLGLVLHYIAGLCFFSCEGSLPGLS